MVISPIQKQILDLESKVEIFNKIIEVSKTEGGRLTDHGKNLIYILREAGLKKSDIARILDITPSALSEYQ